MKVFSLILIVCFAWCCQGEQLPPCTSDMLNHFYTPCTNGVRAAVYYFNQPCDQTAFPLPASTANLSCNIQCDPGQYLPFGQQQCVNCGIGSYSVGTGSVINTFNPIPNAMTTYCAKTSNYGSSSCQDWKPIGDIIVSGNNTNRLSVVSTLKYRAKFLLASGNQIRFTYRVDGESCKYTFCDGLKFYIDDVLQFSFSHVLKWTKVAFNVTQGSHTFQWSYVKDGSVDQGEDIAAIKSIELIGTQFSSEQCSNCAAGFYANQEGSQFCSECDYNTFSGPGSDSCQLCQTGQSAIRGSSQCQNLTDCTTSNYFPVFGTCNPTTLTRPVTYGYWLGTPVLLACNPKTIPPSFNIPCDCPPGQTLDTITGSCTYCPDGYYKPQGGTGACTLCAENNAAVKRKIYSDWSTLPNGFTSTCDGDCEINGWLPRGNVIVPTFISGETNSILYFNFNIVKSNGGWIKITYYHSCYYTYDCTLRLFVDLATADPVEYPLPYGTNTTTVTLAPGEYSAFIQYKHFTTFKTQAFVSSIEIYGTDVGGAASCEMCLAGTEAPLSGSTSCTPCQPGYYNPSNGTTCQQVPAGYVAEGFGNTNYIPCGANTQSTGSECITDCTFSPGAISFRNIVYDLNKLNSPVTMHYAGAEISGFSYYLNVCQRQTLNGTCIGADGQPLNTFGCQRYLNSSTTVDIGKIIGFAPLSPSDLSLPSNQSVLDKGLIVMLTDGQKGCQTTRQTNITMICDVNAGVGSPQPKGLIAETGTRTCRYQFIWRSLYACPKCTVEDYNLVVSGCVDGFQTSTNVRLNDCWDPNPPVAQVTPCKLCPASSNQLTCSGHGTCDITQGICLCESSWSGATCQDCNFGLYGPNCTGICSGGYQSPCRGHGTCFSGVSGNGTCKCSTGWTGGDCGQCDTGYEGTDCTLIPATVGEVFPWWSFIIPVVILLTAALLGFILWRQKRQIENRYRQLETNNPIQVEDDLPTPFPVTDENEK